MTVKLLLGQGAKIDSVLLDARKRTPHTDIRGVSLHTQRRKWGQTAEDKRVCAEALRTLDETHRLLKKMDEDASEELDDEASEELDTIERRIEEAGAAIHGANAVAVVMLIDTKENRTLVYWDWTYVFTIQRGATESVVDEWDFDRDFRCIAPPEEADRYGDRLVNASREVIETLAAHGKKV